MSLTSLINRPCVLVRRVSTDEVDEYGRALTREIRIEAVCELQRISRKTVDEEAGAYGELSDTLWKLFLLPGFDLRTSDVIEVDGVRYELVSDPWDARNPRSGAMSHIEAVVRRTAASEDGS